MANVDRTGFWPIRCRHGGTVTKTRKQALNGNTLAIFFGDCVENDGSGMFYPSAATDNATGTVAQGASYVNARNERLFDKYLPASTTGSATMDAETANFIFVVEDVRNTVFTSQVDGAIAMTDMGLNYRIVLGTGSTTTGHSGHELQATGRATTSTFPWQVTDFVHDPRNDHTLADVKVECHINASTFIAFSGGTGA